MTDILIRLPSSWSRPVTVIVCMSVLGVLDLAGALAAAEWVARRSTAMAIVGVIAFAVLFWFYASALQYAELAIVTFGWIVFLQVALLMLDRFRYGVQLPAGKWAAVVIILAAQAYLILAPSAPATADDHARAEAGDVVVASPAPDADLDPR
jgi:hypothetical protein